MRRVETQIEAIVAEVTAPMRNAVDKLLAAMAERRAAKLELVAEINALIAEIRSTRGGGRS
jgi:hypothetical protein